MKKTSASSDQTMVELNPGQCTALARMHQMLRFMTVAHATGGAASRSIWFAESFRPARQAVGKMRMATRFCHAGTVGKWTIIHTIANAPRASAPGARIGSLRE